MNPWLKILSKEPYVLKNDKKLIDAFNIKTKSVDYTIDYSIPPEPFIGDIHNSEIYLLGLNPGLVRRNDGVIMEKEFLKQKPLFKKELLRNLRQEIKNYPFLFLNPKFSVAEGSKYWMSHLVNQLKKEVSEVNLQKISKKICLVEYFPYHSTKFKEMKSSLESQKFQFEIIRNAIKKNKLVIILRSKKLWQNQIKELNENKTNIIYLKNPQSIYISRNNLKNPSDYDKIKKILI